MAETLMNDACFVEAEGETPAGGLAPAQAYVPVVTRWLERFPAHIADVAKTRGEAQAQGEISGVTRETAATGADVAMDQSEGSSAPDEDEDEE